VLPVRSCTAGWIASLAVAALLGAGCNSKTAPTPENFTTGLNAHFLDHPDCLFPQAPRFPYETSDLAEIKRMDTLVAAQLLTEQGERSIHVNRYTPTVAGTRYAPRFCYGHRRVASIDSFSPPAQANGFPETQVTYHYTMEEVPVWAKSDAVRAAFPAMAHNTSGAANDKATLAGTMAGWQVPD
jgi:hypothetical protein